MGSDQGRGTGETGRQERPRRHRLGPSGAGARSQAAERAARTGFDWPDIEGPKAKIREELDEIAAALPEELEEEVGDLLFAVVNFARFLKIEPEEALRKANRKFEQRFRVDREGARLRRDDPRRDGGIMGGGKQAPADA